ncbi:endo-1,4-beta-xylanase [Flavobacterium glycines]|uniref:Beta-xylanase n=1 Tax=Flavobacterium glycines TaxID=551990 RepID=A0A1B9DGA8_9FLAO|nr:endo-1,4-beta-xylanase [Flavobacterium glycines]OCB68707.1 1,4-beta-xylanase [Flavobacterium glycines]GEL11427.1 beta-xylanase [Flavobacterium glycines]SDJ65425.1 endo-1,4-beta-xylanase [Flavobacterium glycines]
MKSTKPFLLFFSAVITLSSCTAISQKKANQSSLKDAYKNDFYIGTALDINQIEEKDAKTTQLIAKEFNAITAENIMKSMFVHPEKNKFDFETADKFIAFGKKHKMFIHGHTLIWHSQLPKWFSEIKDSAEMNAALENHITTIVKKYKGKVDSWDVVNEAVNDDGTLRKSVFFKALGEDFIAKSFQLAAATDPKVDLYYNDYSMENPTKRAGVIRMVKKIQEKGIKIDGIGMQSHWHLNSPTIEEIEESILEYAKLGVKIAITELDVSVLPSPYGMQGAEVSQRFANNEKMNPYPKSLPDSMQVKLAQRYADIFKLFLKHKDKISRVTFWGVNDTQSWLNDFPIKGRTDYPLLFDANLQSKKAYYNVIEAAKK